MSLLSPEAWRLSLSPLGVAALRRGRGDAYSHAWLPSPPREPGESAWGPALRALRQWLAMTPKGAGRRVTVVVSNHFCRYALVPWNDAVISPDEEAAHARHCFVAVHGNVAETWAIRISSHGWRQTAVASALDTSLIEALEQALEAAGMRLDSVQPYLMAAFNRWRRHLDGASVWFVLGEPGKLCLALLQSGRWTSLDSLHVAAAWPADLQQMLEREHLICGLAEDAAEVYVCAAEAGAAVLAADRPWHLHRLAPAAPRGVAADEAGRFQLAMCG